MARQNATSAGLVLASVAAILFVAVMEHVAATKCYKSEAVGDRDGNVYHCEEKDLPRCCIESDVPTCCKSEAAKNLEEQLQLWGTVAAMVLAVIIVFVCCKNDIACCTSETSLRERFNNLRNKNKAEPLVEEVERNKGHFFDNPAGSPFAYGGARPPAQTYPPKALDPYNFPPLPPLPPEDRNSYA